MKNGQCNNIGYYSQRISSLRSIVDVGFARFTNVSPAASITILLFFFFLLLFSISSISGQWWALCIVCKESPVLWICGRIVMILRVSTTKIWRADDLVWAHYSYKWNEWVVGFVSRDEVFANYINEVGQCLSADHMRKPQMQNLMNGMRNKSINSSYIGGQEYMSARI